MLDPHGQVAGSSLGVEFPAQPLGHRQRPRRAIQGLQPFERAACSRQSQVLRYGELGHQHKVLVDHRHPHVSDRHGVAQGQRRTVEFERSGVGHQEARKQVDQRGLARSVLAQDRVDLAGLERRGHVLERLNGPEALAQAANGDQRLHGGRVRTRLSEPFAAHP